MKTVQTYRKICVEYLQYVHSIQNHCYFWHRVRREELSTWEPKVVTWHAHCSLSPQQCYLINVRNIFHSPLLHINLQFIPQCLAELEPCVCTVSQADISACFHRSGWPQKLLLNDDFSLINSQQVTYCWFNEKVKKSVIS